MKHTNYFLAKPIQVVTALFIMFSVFHGSFLQAQNQDRTTLTRQVTESSQKSGCDLPGEWNTPHNSDSFHSIVIHEGTPILINGAQMNPEDGLGAFYRTSGSDQLYRCGGFDCLPGEQGTVFPVYRDDPDTPEKDGFNYGEQMKFYLYSWTCERAFEVDSIAFDPEYTGTDLWYPLDISVITYLSCSTSYECQIVNNELLLESEVFFKAGIWNELTLIGENISSGRLLELFGSKLIVAKETNSNQMLWPEMKLNTLSGFSTEKNYQIMVNQDCWITLPNTKLQQEQSNQ